VLNLRKRLKLPEKDTSKESSIVVVEAKGGTMNKHCATRKKCYRLFSILAIVLNISLMSGSVFAQDLKDIKQSGFLRHLGIPYANFVTGSGDGMDIEIIRLFARHLGVQYQYVMTDWDNAIGDLTGQKVVPKASDIEVMEIVPIKGDLIANGMTVLPWRQKVVTFSNSTFPNQVWLVARSDSPLKPITPSKNTGKDIKAVKALIAKRSVLCKTGTCLDPSLYDLQATKAHLEYFEGSLNEIAPALLNKKAELSLLDVPDALVALQKWPGKIKVIGPISDIQDMAVAFRRDSPELVEAFNKFLEKIKKDGTYRKIADKYYPFAADYYPAFFKER
jgi:ABC-type amino acid transport substrate-binding protein